MKPYLYILGVLLTGGVIGFFVGQRTAPSSIQEGVVSHSPADPQVSIRTVLERMTEAYKLHDSALLFRDCSASYVEIDANTGESYGLQLALVRYHDEFQVGKSITFRFAEPEISVLQNAAIVRAKFTKLSDLYEDQGFSGFSGEGVWLFSNDRDRWKVTAFVFLQSKKQ